MRKSLNVIGRGLHLLLAGLMLGWGGLAVHFQLDGAARGFGLAALAGLAALFVALAWRGRWRWLWGGMVALLAVLAAWWSTLEPRQDRVWKSEVARGVTAEFENGVATVHNIRDFRWITPTEAQENWVTRRYDPDAITSVDMFLSIWNSPYIAHTLVSFGFEDGRHLVFSGEIRKEASESYSTLGGFFRDYELVLLAADERDIVHLRTDVRGEQVSRYPVLMPPDMRKALFLSFLEMGNDLAENPRWYNTALANCTTVPFRLLNQLTEGLPLDPALLLSGLLPGYLYRLGVLPAGLTLEEIKSRARLGRLGPPGPDEVAFSRRIRTKWAE